MNWGFYLCHLSCCTLACLDMKKLTEPALVAERGRYIIIATKISDDETPALPLRSWVIIATQIADDEARSVKKNPWQNF